MDKPKKKHFKFYSNHHHSVKENIQIIHPVKKAVKSTSVSQDWSFYLPDKSYDEFAHFSGKLKAVEKYLSATEDLLLREILETHQFRVNVPNILKDKVFLGQWPEFLNDLINMPKIVIGLFGFSMQQLVKKRNVPEDEEGEDPAEEKEVIPQKLIPRFVGLQNYLSFQDLRMHNYGKFVTVVGTVVRVSDVKPFCLCMAFKCVRCQEVQVVVQNKGCSTPPNACAGNGCHSKIFKPLLSSHLTQTIPLKTVNLQEMNRDNSEGGRIARTIECELTSDLTNSCLPGDTVVISGIVTTGNSDEGKNSSDPMSYVLQISANSVLCLKGKNVETVDLTSGHLELKSEDLDAIKHIHSEPNLFKLIVSSLAPNIYGHELIKAGLVLGLFGGRDRSKADASKSEFNIRENSHILIVGDPGLGKSQMLLACTNVSPRGVYVCGNSTTSSGLTVTINKSGNSGNCLEAGALVLADQGHCCIDEFDKMMHQHSALLEAMEQQTISMAKSGVVCTLPARTSILAAANPSGGHYNRAKTVSENLKIGGSLLTRFDLVFIIQDEPDQDLDDKMSKHVMGLHTLRKAGSEERAISNYFSSENSFQVGKRLLNKLKLKPGEKFLPIPPAMLQKYISYARKFSQPKITPEVAKILQEFYLDMRKQHKLSYSTPITTRQLESLIRLTEARARVELRAHCTKTDAEDVIEIMKYSMRETYSDQYGNIDFDRSIHGSGMSKSAQAKKLVKIMTQAANTKGDDCFTLTEIKELSVKAKIPQDSFYAVLETLNEQAFILKKGHQLYQLQTL